VDEVSGLECEALSLAITMATNPPHVLCFTEHHSKTYQLDNIFSRNTNLVLNFVGTYTKMVGSVYIYIYIYIYS
jgi:hypothetical protein